MLGSMVHTISIQNWGMKELDERIFGVCINVRDLDLSGNNIGFIPREVSTMGVFVLGVGEGEGVKGGT